MAFRRYSEAYVAEEEQARMERSSSGRSFYPTLGLEASIISGTLSVPIDAQPTKWAASSNRRLANGGEEGWQHAPIIVALLQEEAHGG